MSLLGVGLRTKTFLRFKVYAFGLYVADSALSGPLTIHRGKVGTSAFYQDLIAGDFEKQFVLKLGAGPLGRADPGNLPLAHAVGRPEAARPVRLLLRRHEG